MFRFFVVLGRWSIVFSNLLERDDPMPRDFTIYEKEDTERHMRLGTYLVLSTYVVQD